MNYKVKFGKIINFSLITNCAIFNTLAGSYNNKNNNKNDKGYSSKKRIDNDNNSTNDNNINNNNIEQQEQNPEKLKNKKGIKEEDDDKDKNNDKNPNKEKNKNIDKDKVGEDEKNLKNPKEELIDESEKTNLLKIYDNLSSNINNLINYNSNKFKVENIIVKREDIENCKKTDVETIKTNIKSDRDNFNNKITLIYSSLSTNYEKLKKKLEEDLKKGKEYNLDNLEKLKNETDELLNNIDFNDINKDVNCVNKIVENCKKFDGLINNLDTYLNYGVDEYKKNKIKYLESLKDKFNFAKSEINDFNYNLDEKIKKLDDLNELKEIQVLENEIESKNNKITDYLKKNTYNYNKIISDNNSIVNSVKYLLRNINKNIDVDKYLIDEKKIKNTDWGECITYNEIKEIKKTVNEKDNFVKKENLIKFIEEQLKAKLDQYKIEKDEKRDINILNVLLIYTLFEKNINESELFNKITDGKEIKNKILEVCKINIDNYKELMDVNKVYISYTECYIFAKIDDGEFIIESYSPQFENFCDEYSNGKLKNENSSHYIQFLNDKNIDTAKFDKIFKKDKKYKDIVLLTDRKTNSYLCYCRPDNYSFHIVSVDGDSFFRLFSYYSAEKITILYNSPNITSTSDMFYECTNLKELDLSKFNTSKVTNMSNMFEKCTNLEKLDLSKFNTSNVTNISNMFFGCTNLKKITFGDNFITSNVEKMDGMFLCCKSLENLDLSKFDTSKVEGMHNMFLYCEKLTKLDLSKFDTSKVKNMSMMFKCCTNLKNITFGDKFNTSNVTDMNGMFSECHNLENLDLSKFDTSNVKYMCYMFLNCEKLENITFGDNFNTSNVSSTILMFKK